MIERHFDKQDRRRCIIKLTALGDEVDDTIMPILRDFRQDAFTGISPHELEFVDQIMLKIYNNLSHKH